MEASPALTGSARPACSTIRRVHSFLLLLPFHPFGAFSLAQQAPRIATIGFEIRDSWREHVGCKRENHRWAICAPFCLLLLSFSPRQRTHRQRQQSDKKSTRRPHSQPVKDLRA